MKTRNAHSSGKRTKRATREAHDELLGCRMAMVGLDLFAIKGGNNAILEEIMQRCENCDYREACAVDVKRDPNNPVWETYCPNAKALLRLADESWHTR